MIIGVPKEIKNNEFRVGLTPESVAVLVSHGQTLLVEKDAGLGIGASDFAYARAGATIVTDATGIFSDAELIIKVKEPQPGECRLLRRNQILFTYLHLAADKLQAELLIDSGVTAIAYETVKSQGSLPLLSPMSEVAGKLSVQAGARFLEKSAGGLGILLGGASGVDPAKVLVIGGGIVGQSAARIAFGMGAEVVILDTALEKVRHLNEQYLGSVKCLLSSQELIEEHCEKADLIIGAVLLPGAESPKVITRETLKVMKRGTVIVDVAIDQGGCFETSHPTTHEDPVFIVDGILHYCVANMPGAVPKTSTFALNKATLPYILELATSGIGMSFSCDHGFAGGLNIHQGQVTHRAVAKYLGVPYVNWDEAIKAI